MARFIGRLQGARGPASRLGSSGSGIVASAGGWKIGGRIHVYVGENGKDQIAFWLTAGSNARKPDVLLFTAEDGGSVIDFLEQPAKVMAS